LSAKDDHAAAAAASAMLATSRSSGERTGQFRLAHVGQSGPIDKFWHVIACMAAVFGLFLDDFVFLMPFAADKVNRWGFAAAYAVFIQVPLLIAWSLFGMAIHFGSAFALWLKLLSVGALTVFTIYSYLQWRNSEAVRAARTGQAADATDVANDRGVGPAISSAGEKNPHSSEMLAHKSDPVERRNYYQLFVITVIFNLGNICIYTNMLLASVFQFQYLLVASLLVSLIVAFLCTLLGSIPMVKDFVERIPLWSVLALLVSWCLCDVLKVLFRGTP